VIPMAETSFSLDTVVALQNISVRYRAPEQKYKSFKEYAIRVLQRQVRFREFLALDNISIEVKLGEIFGIIGRNGAGKSTLLKVVSRVINPTNGRVWIKGRVSPLLELGAGFHPELTGRENVFLNGTLLGHTMSEVRDVLDKILDFAELGRFIDAPVRTYSTGMVARLGFSIATAWRPEILIVDEILAVGDEAFREKCYARLEGYRDGGTTTFIVTHNMDTMLSLCKSAIWLDHGKMMAIGKTEDVVAEYHSKGSF